MKIFFKIEVHCYSKVMDEVEFSLFFLRNGTWVNWTILTGTKPCGERRLILPVKQFEAFTRTISNGIGFSESMTTHFDNNGYPFEIEISVKENK